MQYYGETKFEIGQSVEEKILRKHLYFINNYVPKLYVLSLERSQGMKISL